MPSLQFGLRSTNYGSESESRSGIAFSNQNKHNPLVYDHLGFRSQTDDEYGSVMETNPMKTMMNYDCSLLGEITSSELKASLF